MANVDEQLDQLEERHDDLYATCHYRSCIRISEERRRLAQAESRLGHYLDASFAGMGRGAGNCQMELLLSFLHNPNYHLRPVLDCIQEHIEPLREQLMWGFDYPYMITGFRNEHPRAGMAFNASKDRGDIVKFYDDITSED